MQSAKIHFAVSAAHGGIAQLARACGSYPQCPRFESRCRYHPKGAAYSLRLFFGPLVKWLRHRPFTAVTWVRVPYGSPKKRESEQDSLFFGAAPPARDDPLRSNAKGDSHPLSRSPHADLKTGSDFKFTSSPEKRESDQDSLFFGAVPQVRNAEGVPAEAAGTTHDCQRGEHEAFP